MKQKRVFYMIILAVGFFCLAWGMVASAATQNPCSEDIAKFCGKTTLGPAGMVALMDCLEIHEKELSDACRDYESRMGGQQMERSEAVREKRQFRQSCIGDMAKFCKDADPTQGGMFKCLNEHVNELSTPCSQSFKAIR